MEALGRRLSVQGPPKPNSKPVGKKTNRVAVAKGGRKGNASGNKIGDIRELNYEDQVVLWLKRHGGYPREVASYQIEDTLTLKFTIDRRGEILEYKLIKRSKWHLLNRAIHRMMDRASPVPPIPPEIKKDKLTFTIPVHFNPHQKP
jgi:protein TonB